VALPTVVAPQEESDAGEESPQRASVEAGGNADEDMEGPL
jgi:hypothetical protein